MIMNKPEKKKIEHYDYEECAKYVAYKLGYKIENALRDINEKFGKNGYNPDVQYLDFWHCITYNQEINNPCYIHINSNFDWPEWALHIVKCFENEFGEHTEYWVRW